TPVWCSHDIQSEMRKRRGAVSPPTKGLGQLRIQVGVVARNLWTDRVDRHNTRHRDDPDQQSVLDQVLPRLFTHKTSNQCLHRILLLVNTISVTVARFRPSVCVCEQRGSYPLNNQIAPPEGPFAPADYGMFVFRFE